MWQRMHYSKFQIGLALFFFLFSGGIASFLSPKLENKIGTKNVFYISMILPFPIIFLFTITYKTIPILPFVLVALIGFVIMFAVPVMMSMAQKILPQYKSIIGGFINGFSWGVVAIIITMVSHIADTHNCIAQVILIISAIPAICSFLVNKLFLDSYSK
jgi:FSR family fosmidomycin resistance protein-like MFS transporter